MDDKEIIKYLESIKKMVNSMNSGNISHQKPNTVFAIDLLIDRIENQ